MANSKALTIYILILVFFNFFAGQFVANSENEQFSIKKYLPISSLRDRLTDIGNPFTTVISAILIPFVIIDMLIAIIVFTTIGISILPFYINLLIFSPLGIIVSLDYILPLIRGN